MKKILLSVTALLLCLALTSCGAVKKIIYVLTGVGGTDTTAAETFETVIYVPSDEPEEFSPRIPEDGMPYYDTVTRYAWQTLDSTGKADYYTVLEAALGFASSVTVQSPDPSYIWECVFFDTPELFYLDERADVSGQTLTFRYAFDRETAAGMARELDLAYSDFIASGGDRASDVFDRVLFLYEYIINRTRYNDRADEDYEKDVYNDAVYRAICAAGPLIDGYSICIGYARATQYLAQRLGIQTFTVKGRGNSGPHYYCLVDFGGEYSYVDTTWSDPVSSDRSIDYLTYYYFGMTTEDLLLSHEIRTRVPLPVCTATEFNYFIHNNLTADSAKEIARRAFDNYQKGINETLLHVDRLKINDIYDDMWAELRNEVETRGLTDSAVGYGLIKSYDSSVIGVVFHND